MMPRGVFVNTSKVSPFSLGWKNIAKYKPMQNHGTHSNRRNPCRSKERQESTRNTQAKVIRSQSGKTKAGFDETSGPCTKPSA